MENIFYDLTAALWQLLQPVLSALTPLLIGLVLAYLLHPVVNWLRPRLGTGWAILVTYIALFASLAALAGGFVVLILGALPTGGLQETIQLVMEYFEGAYTTATDFLGRWIPAKLADSDQAAEGLLHWIFQRFSFQSLTSVVSEVSGSVVSLFLGVVASIYLLKDRDYFLMLWERLLSLVLHQRTHGIVSEILHEMNDVVSAFLKGALIDSLIVAFLSSAVLSVLQVDFAVVIGVIGGLLNVIPYFGPFIGMVPAFLVALFTDGLAKSIAAVLALFLIQQLDSNYIYPRIVGSSTGLHPLFVLLAVSVCGYFFGLSGMLLAVPAAGMVQVLIKRWAYK